MSDPRTINAYSENLEGYLAAPLPPEQVRVRRAFAETLAEGYVLDLGAGPGQDSLYLMEKGLRVRALDATPAFVEHARAQGVDAHLGQFDDVTEEAVYDGVYASFSLLHAPRADFPRYLVAIHRALKPGGLLFLGMKLGDGEHRDELDRYYTYYTQPELEAALKSAGFRVDDITTGMGKGLAGYYQGFILVLAYA